MNHTVPFKKIYEPVEMASRHSLIYETEIISRKCDERAERKDKEAACEDELPRKGFSKPPGQKRDRAQPSVLNRPVPPDCQKALVKTNVRAILQAVYSGSGRI
jgi:hypothetical protein